MPVQQPKRDWSQYSRAERNKRKMEALSGTCHKIDEYFPFIQEMDRILAENLKLKKDLCLAMEKMCSSSTNDISIPENKLLQLLLQCAKANAGKKPGGVRYSSTVKEFGTLCFVLGGPQLHRILCGGLPLPSITTCRRNLLSANRMEECYFRINEAKEYLLKRNLPTKVVVCEDGTRVTGRIQYDPKTNEIVGFVPPLDHGLPKVRNFPATSAALIKRYFESGVVSSTAYVIMLQPLAVNAAPFCLALYGTDNRFDSSSVDLRWKWMTKAFSDVGLEIVAFSSDGDSRLLKTMVSRTFAPHSPANWPWFQAELHTASPVCIQDTIHILVKLKSKLTKPSDILPMGRKYVASRGHLIELLSSVSKDQHELCLSFIDAKDKMNFRAAQKICHEKVTKLLLQFVPESEATVTFLNMMRDITVAFLEPSLSALDRVKLLWQWIFFLRLWREWIQSNPDYSLSHNFISLNSYTCLEVNAHGLINLIRKFRDTEEPHLLLFCLFSSQACEQFFGRARSITTANSTVINFSILEFVHRIRRIDFIGESQHNLKDIVCFPSLQKSFRKSTNQPTFTVSLPEDYEIEQTMNESFQLALKRCVSLGIAKGNAKCPSCLLTPIDPIQPSPDDDDIDEELVTDSPSPSFNDCEPSQIDGEEEDEELDDVTEDLLVVSSGLIGLQTYNNVPLTPDSPFVKVLDGNGSACIISKTSLCWLYSSGDTKMSSDRLVRVQTSDVNHSGEKQPSAQNFPSAEKPHYEQEVSIGDWCAFTSEDGSIILGRIMAFSYMSGRTWRSQEYSLLKAPVKPPSGSSGRGIGCLCSWFNVSKNGKLIGVNMDTHGYYNINNYICSVPRPRLVRDSLVLTCSLAEIRKLKNHAR